MLLYRDAYYQGPNEKNSVDYQFGDEKVIADITDLNMFLNRHGKPGNIMLDFITSYRRFIGHGDDANPFA
jgi:replicative DNA helicase